MVNRTQELPLGAGGVPRNWGSEAGGMGVGGQFALTTFPVDCLKLHNESSFFSFFFPFFFFFFSVWTSGFGHPCVRFWIFFLEIQEVSFPASLHHICCFSASQRMLGISPWVA